MKTIDRNKIGKIIFMIMSVIFFTLANSTLKADFVTQAESYMAGESIGYYDRDLENRGGAYRTIEGVDIYDIAGIKDGVSPVTPEDGEYRVSYIESGEWLSYKKSIPVGDGGNEAGIYKVYLRVATTLDGNGVRLLNSLNGGPIVNVSSVNFNRTGTFSDAAGAVWKDIEIGTVVLKEGDNLIKLDFTTGAASGWEYSINYLKFAKQESVKLNYDNNGTVDSMFLSKADYDKMSKINITDSAVIGDVEEATVNGSDEIRGFVWYLKDSTIKYGLDIEIYSSIGGTKLITMPNFAIASEINPAITYSTWDMRAMIAAGIFPAAGDYHGFSLGKKAILEHAQLRFSEIIKAGMTVYIKIVPKNPDNATTLFDNKMIVGVVPTIDSYDKSVTVDNTDMSQFPQITVDFTTVGINGISKLKGTSENGDVNELSDISSGSGEVLSIESVPTPVVGVLDIVVVYEDTNSMNNAALTKINATINTITAKGFDVKVEYIKFAVDAANTGNWENAKTGLWDAIGRFPLTRATTPVIEPDKWIVLAAAANGYNPIAADVKGLADRMLRDNIMFTVVDQDTGNNATNDMNHAFLNNTVNMEGIRYYSGHLGVGKTGEYMLDTANLYVLGKIKKWRIVYNSPISVRDGTERRKNFVVIDELGGSHGPAISYYRAPRYGAAEQTIIVSKSSVPFDMRIKPIHFTDDAVTTDYESVKYVNSSVLDDIDNYNYSEERYFMPDFNTFTGVFTTKFTYTGEQDKAYVMINKNVPTSSINEIKKTDISSEEVGTVTEEIKYQDKYVVGTAKVVTGDRESSEWNWSGYANSYFTEAEVMIRVVKGAYAADERYNVFVKDVIKAPAYVYKDNVGNESLMSDFISNDNRKYIDFKFKEIKTAVEPDIIFSIDGVTGVYNYQDFKIKGLPASNSYTIQLYTIRVGNNGSEYKVITYEGSAVLPVENIYLDAAINSPVTNGTFMYSQSNLEKVVVKGRARSIIKKSNSSIPVYEKPMVKVSIYKHGELEPIAGLKDLDSILGDVAVSDGYCDFLLEVEEKTLRDTGAEKFDVKITAINDKKEMQVGVYNVGIDAGAPKVLSVKMVNLTTVNELKAMKLSDGAGDVFNETEAVNLSTLEYLLNTGENYKWTSMGNITFESRKDKTVKDGRFVKGPFTGLEGDEIEVTAVMIDENFDKLKINLEADKNVLKANFEGLNILGYISPTSIEYVPHTVGTGIKITAVWRFNVGNINDATAIMKLRAIDALGNSSESKLGNVEIAVVDNTKPFEPSWNAIPISKDTMGGAVKFSDMLEFVKDGWIIGEDKSYQLNCEAPRVIDINGVRAFKAYYNYDYTESDLGVTRSGMGNHDSDLVDMNGKHYFYIKAGDGINLLADGNTIIPSSGVGAKTPSTTHNDDGKYIYQILAVDKAGNITEVENTVLNQKLYVDTIRPRIKNAVLKKIADRDGFIPIDSQGNALTNPYPDNLAKAGDTVRIEYSVIDFNVSQEAYKEMIPYYYNAGYLWMFVSYPTNPDVMVGNIENELIYDGISGQKGYKADIKIGEKNSSYSNGSIEKPNIIIQNTTSNGNMPITISVKDLAGNQFETTLSPVLDNMPPAAVEVYAYAYEKVSTVSYATDISQSIKEIYNQEPSGSNVHITRGGDLREFYIKLRGTGNTALPADIVYYTVSLGSAESTKKDILISSNNIQFSKTYNMNDFMPVHGVNIVTAKVRDLAGNQSDVSNGGKIVLDIMVGNMTTLTIQQGGTVKTVNGNYEFNVNLTIPEYAGIKEIIPMKISNGTILKEITGVEATVITDDTVPSSLGAEVNQIINNKKILIPKAKIPDVVKGTRTTVTFKITDNLGNWKYFDIGYLIPKDGIEIKAQQEGSEKETRTKIKVVGENQFELQKIEETGKGAPVKR